SFDGIDRAQYTDPALSTIHQHPEVLGRTAPTLLLQQMLDHAAVANITYVSTTLVPRRSCGCAGPVPAAIRNTTGYQHSEWQNTLAQQLVRRLGAALPVSAVIPPEVM